MRPFLKRTFACFATVAYFSFSVASNSIAQEPATNTTVVLTSDVEWRPLNPARGNKGPKAGSLWGDITGTGPSGFLVKFVDGFSSPPHIHNISYRGVVISGLIHNDDPNAAEMLMPESSFWTQPKGEAHITSARGSNAMAYIEIEEGPYLVHPANEAFDSGERPVNVDVSNLVWMNHPKIPGSSKGPKIAFLWGKPHDNHLNGTLVRFPAGFVGKIHSHSSIFRAVVIQGRPKYQMPEKNGIISLEPGSYFSTSGESVHEISCEAEENCIIYVRTKGKFDLTPTL